jgi:hypothetical protein
MKEPVEIIISKHGITLCHPTDCAKSAFIARDEKGIGGSIGEFIKFTNAAPSTITLFVAEELLFFKAFELPLDTSDLKEAVSYQLELTTPFNDETPWYNFEAVRAPGRYQITLYAAQSGYIDVYIQEMIEAGFQISGLYPESQRFVCRLNRKNQWGLLLPGRFVKAYVFNGTNLEDRLLCSAEPSFQEAVEVCRTDKIYRLGQWEGEAPPVKPEPEAKPYFEYLDARLLLEQRPLLKSYNLLPASYQQPDYLKIVIGVLLVLNIATFLAFGMVKTYKLWQYNHNINQAIADIMPKVHELRNLEAREEKIQKAIHEIESNGKNIDLISFLTKLTRTMPPTSYIDQLRFNPKTGIIEIMGYTEDVGALTKKLQKAGTASLKSTSRRRGKTYFNVEITP